MTVRLASTRPSAGPAPRCAAPPAAPCGAAGSEGPEVFLSQEVVGGVPWAVLSRCALFAGYFLLSVVLVRNLGAEGYGVYTLCKSLCEYLVVACGLGLNTGLVRFVPELVVTRNRAGLRRLLSKTAALQGAAAAVSGAGLWLVAPLLEERFDTHFGALLLLMGALVAVRLARDFVSDALTAVFQVRAMSVLSVLQAALWVTVLAVVLARRPTPDAAFAVQIGTGGAMAVAGAVVLARYLCRLDWRSPTAGIGRRRAMAVSLPSLVNAAVNLLMQKHTEVLFLGLYAAPAAVALFDVGFSVPLMAITLLPTAVQKLFTSGICEAYARDRQSLGRLVGFAYKALILAVAPLTAMGVALGPRGVELIYGAPMAAAGGITALFFAIHAANLFYVPLAMAVVTREKVLQMLPLSALQLATKVLLDALLIPRWGIHGAAAAVAGAFALTLPVHLLAARRFVGGVYFPGRFLLRILPAAAVVAAVDALLAPRLGIAGLLATAAGSTVLFAALVRAGRLVRPEDVAGLYGLRQKRLDQLLGLLVSAPRRGTSATADRRPT